MNKKKAKRDGPSADEILGESQTLLRETVEYLARLPTNPLTAQLMRRIQDHLDSPETAVAARRAAQAAEIAQQTALRDTLGLHGSPWYLSSGLPALELSMLGSLARITSPAAASYGSASAGKTFALDLAAKLGEGIEFQLHANRSPKTFES